MKRITRKLSGPAKDRFFARFVANEPGLDPDLASRLVSRCNGTITSIRIRRAAVVGLERRPAPIQTKAASSVPVAEAPTTPMATATFDPYVFGLVPVFQREGRDGLMARLATIAGIDELRLMAKTQQIVLAAELRQGDVAAAALRAAIADAVAKRIADRRAAAG